MKESRYNVWAERPDGAYVYNGVTGTLLRVPLADRAALERMTAGDAHHGLSIATADKLVQGRMIVADTTDELDLLRARYERSRHNTSSFGLTIVTSLGCNFDCPYCFEAKHPSILSPAVEASVLRVLDDQLPRIDDFHVTWFGGEPLVGKRPLLALSDGFIERCDRAGVAYDASISTNGYLLNEETCRELADRRVTSAQVGLDGPPEVHNRMRPLVSGGDSFWRIVENLHHAVEHFDVAVRVNVDASNVDCTEELLQILTDEGLAGKLVVYPGHLVGVTDNNAPSATYRSGNTCYSPAEFATASLQFNQLARDYDFGNTGLPQSAGTPCTAVRANELIVGSDGELYKCWDSVGDPLQVIGHIDDYENLNGRLRRWLKYDPFTNDECMSCMALPVCMGGCAHHAMDINLYEDRCGTFRFNYQERVEDYIESRVAANEPVSVGAPTRRTRRDC